MSGLLIADAVTVPAEFVPNMSEIPGAVAARARRGDLVLTIGAGDITMQAAPILSALAQQG